MRRAVIIVNIILLLGDLIAILYTVVVVRSNTDLIKLGIDHEDETIRFMETAIRNGIIVQSVQIALSLVAIAGSITYNWYPVVCKALALVVQYALYLYFFLSSTGQYVIGSAAAYEEEGLLTPFNSMGVVNLVFNFFAVALCVYPMVGFTMEVRKGTMSKQTYHREEASCCCLV